ncbi:hypothetical protein BJF92_20415 [Rhizobium rhizosphaerae]|uniref:MAPEG family protein n=1 Tax=Xaviernesmea rhizosphaerae TaxID=1672749 RepID=A0A1Q9ALJ0_9HYPH|nr:MAPEG family protein [Xaviernesmea rhizosphaerae]OLP56160.1 hypothetical protein BJF92_20415 [Xaviernesmea rhizosphaerae]OQP86961.1 hypothetical protein BTR14_08505 [Xaviernesmea rhizosphaerae]
MDPMMFDASPFPALLAWSVVLLFVHISLQAMLATRELGSTWNAGPRDDGRKPEGKLAGRAERASLNFRETYPAFVALAVAQMFTGDPTDWGFYGGCFWLVMRIAYVPLYLFGIPYIRSLAWLGSVLGLVIMAFHLIF